MKLYIWTNLNPEWSGVFMAFAMAESEEQARELVLQSDTYTSWDISGSPDKVIDVPYGEMISFWGD